MNHSQVSPLKQTNIIITLSISQLIWITSNIRSDLLASDESLEYNRDIRPILVDRCFSCHGPDSAARQADLRLDRRDDAIARGAIVPGKPEESELYRRITSQDDHERMPPPSTKKVLNPSEIEMLRRWIENGAEYQPHWSLIPPVRPPLPEVKNSGWIRNPIDYFILAKLEAAGLEPAPEADRHTLARRLALDLTGLPPSPEDVHQFVHDTSPDYYENYVMKLMSSAHWGEHRARPWLDAARYADTHGIHFDNYREIWAYRDWVIAAFNRNMPFDQFTIEQLAGDLLPQPSLEQLIATGFHRCQMTTNEGCIIDEEYLVLYTRERTEVTSTVWLGLTMNCAPCHEHKFDPITQREFYELAAFFNNTTIPARDGNVKDSPPVIVVPRSEDRSRWEELPELVQKAREAVENRRKTARPTFDEWTAKTSVDELRRLQPSAHIELACLHRRMQETDHLFYLQGDEEKTVDWLESPEWTPGPHGHQAVNLSGKAMAAWPSLGDLEHDQTFSVSAWVKLSAIDSGGALLARMDQAQEHRGWDLWIEGRRVGMHLIHAWPQEAIKVVTQRQVPAQEWTHICITYDGTHKASGLKIYINGELQPLSVQSDSLQGNSIKTTVPLKLGQRHAGQGLPGAAVCDVRIYRTQLSPGQVETLARIDRFVELLQQPSDQRKPEDWEALFRWWLSTLDLDYQRLTRELTSLEREQADIKARGTVAYIMQEKSGIPTAHVLYRGDYDKPREQVTADTPDCLPPFPESFPRNRLGLAQWLLLDHHPLTARVTVNRFWQEVFGTALVRTTGDFGVSGELPSHPELLDWLAVDFRENGWDIKRLFFLMVTSATYRQASVTTPEKLEKDPQNRMLSRGPRFRMDAEMIRDYALKSSGLLVPKIGGPSVKPYQPPGLWEAIAMNVSNTRSYQRDVGEGSHRRSLYTFWKRQVPPASMEILNAPNREYCVVRRERTNTPLQALVTLNDTQFVEAAKALAEAVLLSSDIDDSRLQNLALHILCRPLNAQEMAVVVDTLQRLRLHYQGDTQAARQLLKEGDYIVSNQLHPEELAAWTMLANMLYNLDEALNK